MKTKLISFLCSERSWRYLLSLAIALVFVTAGATKLADPSEFTQDILRFRMLSEELSTYLAASLPWLEIMIGASLFIKPIRLSGSLLMLGLMIVFTFAIAIALARGLDISCGCFGKSFEEYAGSGLSFLMRDLVLLAAVAMLFQLIVRRDRSDRSVNNMGVQLSGVPSACDHGR